MEVSYKIDIADIPKDLSIEDFLEICKNNDIDKIRTMYPDLKISEYVIGVDPYEQGELGRS
jgi:hypothetical protein